jgi:hypothetical protein
MNKIKLKLSFDFVEVLGYWIALKMLPPEYKFTSVSEMAMQMQITEINIQLKTFVNTPRSNKRYYNISIIRSYGLTVLHLIYNSGHVDTYTGIVLHEVKKQLEEIFFIKGPFKFPVRQLSI